MCLVAHLKVRPQLMGLCLSYKGGWESDKLGFLAFIIVDRLCLPPRVGRLPNTERGFRSGSGKAC